MWKASAGHQTHNVITSNEIEDDDWETDPDFVNDVSEEEQRWGSKTVVGSGRTAGTIDMEKLRDETEKSDADKKKQLTADLNIGYGYGGKFGVQKDRVDKSAENWDYKEKVVKHSSQKDYSEGFGGKFGVQNDRVDKSAVGWDHVEKVEKHDSQKDYSKGFGGKFGIEEDRKDKSALGWDHIEAPQKHESQLDHKIGFGGKFGVQNDRMDKSALGFSEQKEKIGTNYTKVKPDIGSAKPSNLRAKFENFAKSSEEEAKRKAEEQKKMREEKDKYDREQAALRNDVETNGQDNMSSSTRKPAYVDTGRSGGISSAINAFNQIQSPVSEAPKERKAPVKLPKETVQSETRESIEKKPEPEPENIPDQVQVQPDLIPINESKGVVPSLIENQEIVNKEIDDTLIYNNTEVLAPPVEFDESAASATAAEVAAEILEPIYQNQENISDYIEDTGIKAVALYDYQAAAEDEISFDPDDIITHIEMIDEGWWRGLSKNRFGLFPANYVQLVEKQQT